MRARAAAPALPVPSPGASAAPVPSRDAVPPVPSPGDAVGAAAPLAMPPGGAATVSAPPVTPPEGAATAFAPASAPHPQRADGEPGAPAAVPAWWIPCGAGVHRVHVRTPDHRRATATLVVAPARVPQPPGRSHGFLVQLYSLLSARSWGMGDLGDLADLAAWSGRTLGSGFVQVNPLHAAVQGSPTDPSPYRPSSRRFPDPVHLRVESIPEYGHVRDRAALDDLRQEAAALSEAVLNKGALIDRDAVWELKRQALELVVEVPLTPAAAPPTATSWPSRGRRWRTTPCGARSPRCTAPTGTPGPRPCATPAPREPPAPAPSCWTGSTSTAASPG